MQAGDMQAGDRTEAEAAARYVAGGMLKAEVDDALLYIFRVTVTAMSCRICEEKERLAVCRDQAGWRFH